MEPKSPSKLKLSFTRYNRILRIVGVSFATSLLILVAFILYNNYGEAGKFKSPYYTVVLDCGSTGTRVSVYEWKTRGIENNELPIVVRSYPDNSTSTPLWRKSCSYHCLQTEPGLDKLVGNASGVRASLKPLILLAEEWVPVERRHDSPIFVLATAGLRKLRVEDARWVLDEVEDIVSEHAFRYSRSWIRVLSGKEEAYYGWVALNYRLGSLVNSSQGSTLGLLDVGGSSLQVVVEVNDVRDDYYFMRSKIGPVEHKILAYSLLEFGLNEAFDRTVTSLRQMQPISQSTSNRTEIRHPCLSSDFVKNYSCYGCARQGISDQKILSSKILGTEFMSIYLLGDPDWEKCKELAKAAALNLSGSDWLQAPINTSCKAGLSSFSGIIALNLTAGNSSVEHFHALSGFFAVNYMLNLSSRANLTKIWEKGQDLCLRSWGDFGYVSENPNYVGQYCFRVPYMLSLIEYALCLGERQIEFGPGDISWTLGAALVEGEYLWIGTQTSSSGLKSMEVISSPIFVFVLLFCLLLIVYFSQVKLPMPGKKGTAAGASLPSYTHPRRRPN